MTAGCHTRRLNRLRASGPPRGAVKSNASCSGPTNLSRCSSSRRITDRATGTVRLEREVFGSLPRVTWPRTSIAVLVTVIRDRKTSMLPLVRPAASPQRRPAKAPTSTMALYLSGMASTSCSTSDWERNRGGLSGSEGNGTLIAGLIAIRLSAIAASRHWRSAKTALRTRGRGRRRHLRHPASNGRVGDPDQWCAAEPRQHLHLQRYLEPRAGGQPKVVPGLDPLRGPPLQSDLTATGITPQSAADVELDLSFSAFGIDEAPLCLAVGLPAVSR